ncbi:unnamed protein product [Polarella glacialis]|uniref:Uncharacterized protein n=1 Tax=Polarella glacialis TaxID=89957 RepID=A0A813E6R0_POLGL|nr:unnamed protein product [Polarella glacialis]
MNRIAVSQNSINPTAYGGQDKTDESEPAAYGGQDKVDEMEPAAIGSQALTDRSATQANIRQDTRERVQKQKPKNREPPKNWQHQLLCKPRQIRTSKTGSQAEKVSAETMPK